MKMNQLLTTAIIFLLSSFHAPFVSAKENPKTSRKDRIDLIDLIDFDVQILLKENTGVQIFEVTDYVTDWINESFEKQLWESSTYGPEYATFDSVILLPREDRRLQSSDSGLYTAKFKGAALFSRDSAQLAVPGAVVTAMLRSALIDDEPLLTSLQNSDSSGLGSSVIDVRAYINPGAREPLGESTSDNLEVVIIIAIVVACVAFSFLVFAIFWAWRYDRRNRRAYTIGKGAGSFTQEQTTAENSPASAKSPRTRDNAATNQRRTSSDYGRPAYPTVIGGGGSAISSGNEGSAYPESVISEDISTSLSQYYRSGMGPMSSANFSGSRNNIHQQQFNDGASISSMESYGYSLDGYTPTVTQPIQIDLTVGTSIKKDPTSEDDDMEKPSSD